MERLRKVLKNGLKGLNAEEAMQAGRVFAAWPEVVGPAIAPRTQPRFLKDGVLFVEVSSAAWANELALLKPGLLQQLDRRLGRGIVKDVRWQLVPSWRPDASREAPQPASPRSDCPEGPLDPGRAEAIASEVASRVPDPELARPVRGLLAIVARREAAKKAAGYRACRSCGVLIPPKGPERCPVCRLGLETPG